MTAALDGRRILVVGAGQQDYGQEDPPSGIGRAIARAAARAGARLVVSDIDEAAAQARLLGFLKPWVPAGKSPMCGNSICQDRRLMARSMPQLEAYFHYRNLDVSTLKELCKRWAPAVVKGFTKRGAHTALADIQESIDELRYYRQHFIGQGGAAEIPTQAAIVEDPALPTG